MEKTMKAEAKAMEKTMKAEAKAMENTPKAAKAMEKTVKAEAIATPDMPAQVFCLIKYLVFELAIKYYACVTQLNINMFTL